MTSARVPIYIIIIHVLNIIHYAISSYSHSSNLLLIIVGCSIVHIKIHDLRIRVCLRHPVYTIHAYNIINIYYV